MVKLNSRFHVTKQGVVKRNAGIIKTVVKGINTYMWLAPERYRGYIIKIAKIEEKWSWGIQIAFRLVIISENGKKYVFDGWSTKAKTTEMAKSFIDAVIDDKQSNFDSDQRFKKHMWTGRADWRKSGITGE